MTPLRGTRGYTFLSHRTWSLLLRPLAHTRNPPSPPPRQTPSAFPLGGACVKAEANRSEAERFLSAVAALQAHRFDHPDRKTRSTVRHVPIRKGETSLGTVGARPPAVLPQSMSLPPPDLKLNQP